MDIGNAIKTLRKQKKITQKQLAELCEISTNALCSIETLLKLLYQKYVLLLTFQSLICYFSAYLRMIFQKTRKSIFVISVNH